ncbi:hypothetical protein SELMODRAFT_404872 [Selaginella moellendorffii]|uniref:Uncharacterized protein n=1 Tax=Selaginella moellendorffii TaxID=88036 RepID=D8QXM3_SELML|nr:hypothetical protein SELMODRAFT_404872 [Selaginella moellendorffii]
MEYLQLQKTSVVIVNSRETFSNENYQQRCSKIRKKKNNGAETDNVGFCLRKTLTTSSHLFAPSGPMISSSNGDPCFLSHAPLKIYENVAHPHQNETSDRVAISRDRLSLADAPEVEAGLRSRRASFHPIAATISSLENQGTAQMDDEILVGHSIEEYLAIFEASSASRQLFLHVRQIALEKWGEQGHANMPMREQDLALDKWGVMCDKIITVQIFYLVGILALLMVEVFPTA